MKSMFAVAASAALVVTALAVGAGKSGLQPGENVVPFHPTHLSGPLANTTNCFPCTFQQRPQVQVWVNGDDIKNVASIAKTLNSAMSTYKAKEFKALVVFVTNSSNRANVTSIVKAASRQPGLTEVGMAVIDKADGAVNDYKINLGPEIKNTVFVYRNWKVAKTFVNLKGDDSGLASLNAAIASIATN